MSYVINNSRGNIVAIVPDGTVNTTATPITFVGRGVTSYGTAENENYLWILENFANSTAPPNPILGQLWYDSSTDELYHYNSLNTWSALATQTYVQAQKVSPTFTGNVTINGNITATGSISTGGGSFTGNVNINGNITTTGTVTAGSISTSGGSFKLPVLTQAEINALTPTNGDLVYNTTVDFVQCFQANAWVSMTLATYS
jgi:hypothetical protein